jgi:beta-N-acetylhexosaminidase
VPIPQHIHLVLAFVRLAIVLALLPLAFDWRSPPFASVRPWMLTALIGLPLLLIATELWIWRSGRTGERFVRAVGISVVALAVLDLGAALATEMRFRWMRQTVLNAAPPALEKLGRHLVVGYRDPVELALLVDRRAIAGVFLSARNVLDKTIDAIRQDIAALQEKRREQGLPPLWIATDQEGGGVSRLSPPLTRMPAIAEVVASHRDRAERQIAVRQYAAKQGRELAALGVNLNFAPVVDLNHGLVNPTDRLTRITERAISKDPAVVAEVADLYCMTLLQTGVHCTLKHFPGLGRVHEDTHLGAADLAADTEDLAATDWLPFRKLMPANMAFTMLAHARLTALDDARPASFSPAVVDGLLRGTWKHEGVLITDDFGMAAVDRSRDGIAGGSVEALNAGVDLILVSYDPDQYYTVMYALLQADHDGRLRQDALERSVHRLRRAAGR